MSTSILYDVKKVLGIDPAYTAFDQDIIMHINTAFSTLNQLGIGPLEGFQIDDQSLEWEAFLGTDPRLNSVKSYIYLRLRLLFDPPATSFAIASMEKQIQEVEWRLNVQHEHDGWINPLPPAPEDVVYDGGEP